MSARRGSRAGKLSRRRFVSLLAVSSAAVIADPAAAAKVVPATRRKPVAGPTAKPLPAVGAADQKEFERQRANTLGALKVIRAYKLPPGGDLPVVFRPLPNPRRSR